MGTANPVKRLAERVRHGRRPRIAAVLVVLAAGVVLTLWRAPDLGDVLGAFSGLRWPLVAAAIVAGALSVTCRGLVWRFTLRQAVAEPLPPLRHVLAAHWIGVLGNLLFPARAGEATRIGFLVRHLKGDGSWPAVTGAALAHRVLEAVPMAVLIVVALAVAPLPAWSRTLLVALAVGIGVALGAVLLAARDDGDAGEDGVVSRLRGGLSAARKPLPTLLALLSSIGAISFHLAALWLVLRAFELDVGLTGAAVVLILAELVVVFPLWPGNVGVYQGVIAAGLLPFGVPYATGLAYGLVTQSIDAVVAASGGAVALVHEGTGVRELRGQER